MGRVNVNVVIDEEILEKLQQQVRGNRGGHRSSVKRALPIEGVDVTVPDDHRMEPDTHSMNIEELLEWVVYQLSYNRQI